MTPEIDSRVNVLIALMTDHHPPGGRGPDGIGILVLGMVAGIWAVLVEEDFDGVLPAPRCAPTGMSSGRLPQPIKLEPTAAAIRRPAQKRGRLANTRVIDIISFEVRDRDLR